MPRLSPGFFKAVTLTRAARFFIGTRAISDEHTKNSRRLPQKIVMSESARRRE
jgi:hypothetical protein